MPKSIEIAEAMQQVIESAKSEGDSLGGVVECHIAGLPVGLGQPVFHRFEADLAFCHAIDQCDQII